ncbi:MAG: BamA/OMP85 family outer membrane protein, partial [Bacteroidales bacterium]
MAHAQGEVAIDALNDEKPVILYSGDPKKYVIADIVVEGADNYEDNVVINISGLRVGETVEVPGDDITEAAKRYWKHGLFSDVSISADKIVDNQIWLRIKVSMRPRVSEVNYHGMKKSEQEDIQARIGMIKGSQITPNAVSRAETLIKRYFDDKGFKNAEVKLVQRDDPVRKNEIIVDVNVDKKEKVKVHQITIEGNQAIKTSKLKRVMKKTNEKNKLVNFFKTKKFVPEKYEEDKQLIIDKYNELGYRDAVILMDSVSNFDENTVDVYIKVEEGDKYYIRNITWVGNTVYPSDILAQVLQMKPGDVYNQKKLEERTVTDDESVGNLYYNNGYLFYSLDPVEVNIVGDSIDLEMRIYEGQQATVNKVTITGNDRLYEDVVRRELYVKP